MNSMKDATDTIKVSESLTMTLHHSNEMVVLSRSSREPHWSCVTMTIGTDDFKTMVAQYLLLRHMERMKEVSTDQLLEAISIDL